MGTAEQCICYDDNKQLEVLSNQIWFGVLLSLGFFFFPPIKLEMKCIGGKIVEASVKQQRDGKS